MRFIDYGAERYVRMADVIELLVEFAPVVRDKVGVDWPVRNLVAHILEQDLRDPARRT